MSQNDLAKFDKLKADITVFVEPTFAVAIVDDDAYKNALAIGSEIKKFQKAVEERRKELVKPHNEHVKKINSYAGEISTPLEKAEAHLKFELTKWARVLEQKRIEETKRIEADRIEKEKAAKAKAEALKEESETMAMFMSKPEAVKSEIIAQAEAGRLQEAIAEDTKAQLKLVTDLKVSGSKQVWKFEITDIDKVPREYLIVDEKKLRADMNAGLRELSGVTFYQDISIALR